MSKYGLIMSRYGCIMTNYGFSDSDASHDLGFNKVVAANPRNAGAADISFAANHVDMALDGLGLMGSGAHTKNETADLTSLDKNIKKTALLIYRLGQL